MQPCLNQFASFSIFNKNSDFEVNMNPNLRSQINEIILGWIYVYQLGDWWNLYIKSFFNKPSFV